MEKQANMIQDEMVHLRWQALMIEATYMLSAFFRPTAYLSWTKEQSADFSLLIETLYKLSKMPGHEGYLAIQRAGDKSREDNYIVKFGHLCIDKQSVPLIIKEGGVQMSHLTGRMGKACKRFSDVDIRTLILKIPDGTKTYYHHLMISLTMLSNFYRETPAETSTITVARKKIKVSVVKGISGFPDLNLTLLSIRNGLSLERMYQLMERVGRFAKQNESVLPKYLKDDIYSLIFKIDALKRKLSRPPIEVNTLWNAVTSPDFRHPFSVPEARKKFGTIGDSSHLELKSPGHDNLFSTDPAAGGMGIAKKYERDALIDGTGVSEALHWLVRRVDEDFKGPDILKQHIRDVLKNDYEGMAPADFSQRLIKLIQINKSLRFSIKLKFIKRCDRICHTTML